MKKIILNVNQTGHGVGFWHRQSETPCILLILLYYKLQIIQKTLYLEERFTFQVISIQATCMCKASLHVYLQAFLRYQSFSIFSIHLHPPKNGCVNTLKINKGTECALGNCCICVVHEFAIALFHCCYFNLYL